MQSRARRQVETKKSLKLGKGTGSVRHIGMSLKGGKLKDVLTIAEESGLFRGTRTKIVRGRMPEALVSKAKARTGISSDTDLLEVALASLAVADDFPDWLLSHRGTIKQDIDLEF